MYQKCKPNSEPPRFDLIKAAYMLGGIVLFLWLIEFADLIIFRGSLDYLGVYPRTLVGLRNIFFSPFLHSGFGHLISNTFPFLILGGFVLLRGTKDFAQVTLIAAVVSGFGVWLLGGAQTVHIGASGIVFGYLGYLILRGYFERSFVAILIALVTLFFFSGLLWGVLPLRMGISWLGHLFGFVGGGLAAYWIVQQQQKNLLS
ncbi:rhomboid family intramembrane serine protease [Chloroflexi bacterium TSY]|nr:rhomboid family intramembrane serine protease [Chloroflexi bacterium TSY]